MPARSRQRTAGPCDGALGVRSHIFAGGAAISPSYAEFSSDLDEVTHNSSEDPLLKALDVAGSPVDGSTFEFEPDETEGTNFDFMIPSDTGSRVYFEVKYTERKFGTAKEDDEQLRKFESVYSSGRRVANRFQPPFCSASGFLKNYQILRNIWHLDLVSGDTAVFLFPKANDCLAKAEAIIHSCLLESFRPRVIVMHLEDLIDRLAALTASSSEPEKNLLAEFRLKYLPSALNGESTSAHR